MSLLLRTMPFSSQMIPIHSPGVPESYVCGPQFGQDIVPFDCQLAVILSWPSGRTPVHYYFRDPSASNSKRLPIHEHYGSCTISIETAGPPLPDYLQDLSEPLPQMNYFSIVPDALRGIAGFLIQKCAQEQGGLGGYITLHFSAAEEWLESLAQSVTELRLAFNSTNPRPNDGKFLTVSITNPSGFAISPGDTDPAIAARLALYAANLTERVPSHEMPARKSYFQELANDLREKAMRMTRGRSDGEKWWTGLDEDYDDDDSAWGSMPYDTDDDDNSPAGNDAESTASSPAKKKGDDSDGDGERGKGKSEEGQKKEAAGGASTAPLDMVYDCDGTLGSPTALDCEKLSWSGLQPASTTETLIPGQPKIYTQGTCALGISTAIPTTITWAHILAAFETLNTLCVQNPLKAVKGGRAFFGQQHQQQGVTAGGSGWMGGRRRTKDKRDGWWTWMWASSSSSKSKGKRDQVGDVSGAEALPAGINATVWRHGGAGTAEEEGEEAGRLQCEWAKAVAGLDVSGCS